MSFIQDASAQTSAVLPTNIIYFTTKTKPNLSLNTASGIYNPADNIFKIFTNNTDALTINSSQEISGNGSGLTNLNYNNISNPPTLSIYLTSATASSTYATQSSLSSYLTSTTASLTYATITNLSTKENALTFSLPLIRNSDNISINLSSYDTIALRNTALSNYLTLATASNTYATISNLSTKENALTFSAPLTRATNTISLDLSSYDTIALRNTALSNYLTSATASNTYATITNLNAKENALTFSAPLTRATNTISLDLSSYDTIALRNTALSSYLTTATASSTYATQSSLSSYLTSATASSTYATITNLNTKENALTFSAPLTRTTNTISLDLSSYDTIALRNTALSSYLTSATASSTYATITNLNAKENALTFSAPLTRATNTISLDLSSYDTITARTTAVALKQDLLSNGTLLLGNGSNITNINYNNIPNRPVNPWITSANSIYYFNNYNTVNVGIGTNAPLSFLDIYTTTYTGALLTLDAGVYGTANTAILARAIGQPLIKLGRNSYTTATGDYYGIGFGFAPALTDKNCCEIGCFITNTTGSETGDLVFSTRPNTSNISSTERMRITSAGNVGIGSSPTCKLDIFEGTSTGNDTVISTFRVISSNAGSSVGGNTTSIAKFLNSNQSKGIAIQGDGVVAIGSNTNNDIVISSKGTGQVKLNCGYGGGSGSLTIGFAAGICGFDSGVNIYRSTIGAPSVGNYGSGGDRLILYQGGASAYPYSLGIDSGIFWHSVPTSATHRWYTGGTNNMTLDSGNNLTVSGTINSSSGESTFKYIRIINPDGRNTHFCYSGNNQNYIRGQLNVDQDNIYCGGNVSATSFTTGGNLNCAYVSTGNIDANSINLTGTRNLSGNINGYYIYGPSSVDANQTWGSSMNLSIISAGMAWFKSWIAVSSDVRIKTNIKDIEDDLALQKLLSIQPKTYQYIDKIDKGNNTVYGFIAQQIREVIPEAVKLTEEVIPNIYKTANLTSNLISLDIDISNKLKVDDEICILTSNEKKNYKILSVDENTFTINENLEGDKCFVYGTKINDFHTLDKNYVYTLNVCATQELYKLIQQQSLLIQSLEERIRILEAK